MLQSTERVLRELGPDHVACFECHGDGTRERYNGWTNYETWTVPLILDNDEGTYEEIRNILGSLPHLAREYATAKQAWIYDAEAALKDYCEDLGAFLSESHQHEIPEQGRLLVAQMFSAALGSVNWREIAEHLYDELHPEGK